MPAKRQPNSNQRMFMKESVLGSNVAEGEHKHRPKALTAHKACCFPPSPWRSLAHRAIALPGTPATLPLWRDAPQVAEASGFEAEVPGRKSGQASEKHVSNDPQYRILQALLHPVAAEMGQRWGHATVFLARYGRFICGAPSVLGAEADLPVPAGAREGLLVERESIDLSQLTFREVAAS